MTSPLYVGISGPSCSGKSTLALNLCRILKNPILIHLDDFYLPDSQIPRTDGLENWDCPEAFDMQRLKEMLEKFHKSGQMPPFKSYEAAKDVDKVEPAGAVPEIDRPIVILEGIMLYYRNSPLVDLLNLKFLVTGDRAVLRQRRESRTYETVEGFWKDPPGYFDKIVYPEFVKNFGYLFDDLETFDTSPDAHRLHIERVPEEPLPNQLSFLIQRIASFNEKTPTT